MAYVWIVPTETRPRLRDLLDGIETGRATAGGRLVEELGKRSGVLDEDLLFDALLNTKLPQIFAESAVAGDGSDWTPAELGILGDVSISVPVKVFDNGAHRNPVVHDQPFAATLVFTPGALLCNGRGARPVDWDEVTDDEGNLCPNGYFGLYERRLLPVLRHIDGAARAAGRPALVTIPGLGCGQFAGPFRSSLGRALQVVLKNLLDKHGACFPNIRAVYFDPFDEGDNLRREIHGISWMVRPLLKGNAGKSQLCQPASYAERGDDFSECLLFSIVAWDHVSWPGNDFFAGSRCTDDGVKAAATDSMAALTGVEGGYDVGRHAYLPPAQFRTWGEVVADGRLRLKYQA